jgi:2-methylcitrate dehydratase PrpD
MVAMASVLMAQEGFIGIEPLFSESPDKKWIEGMGNEYLMLNLYFKPYAVCRWSQPAVTGALRVMKENDLRPWSISRIRVRTFEAAAALSCDHPKNTEEAQYNLAYPVAAALYDGQVGPSQVLPPRIFDNSLLELADKVEVEVASEFEQIFPQKTYAEVVIRTEDGRELTSGPVQPLWEPGACSWSSEGARDYQNDMGFRENGWDKTSHQWLHQGPVFKKITHQITHQ